MVVISLYFKTDRAKYLLFVKKGGWVIEGEGYWRTIAPYQLEVVNKVNIRKQNNPFSIPILLHTDVVIMLRKLKT